MNRTSCARDMEAPEKKRDERGRPIAHTRRNEWQDQNSSPRAEEWKIIPEAEGWLECTQYQVVVVVLVSRSKVVGMEYSGALWLEDWF